MKYSFRADKKVAVLEFLSDRIGGITPNSLKKLLKQREIKIDGKRIDSNVTLEIGDIIDLFVPSSFVNNNLTVVYEDENIVVVDKSAYMSVTGGLVEILKGRYEFIRPVHRLDSNTMGLVVLAKNEKAESILLTAFKERRVKKIYRAIVAKKEGYKISEGINKAFLFKDEKKGVCYVSDTQKAGYKEILTGIKLVRELKDFEISEGITIAEVELTLLTGRTHQLRAHLKHLNLPIIGDDKYGDHKLNKMLGYATQQLQAVSIEFEELPSPLDKLNKRIISINSDFKLKK